MGQLKEESSQLNYNNKIAILELYSTPNMSPHLREASQPSKLSLGLMLLLHPRTQPA